MTSWTPTRATHTPLTPGKRRTPNPRLYFLAGLLLAMTAWGVSELLR